MSPPHKKLLRSLKNSPRKTEDLFPLKSVEPRREIIAQQRDSSLDSLPALAQSVVRVRNDQIPTSIVTKLLDKKSYITNTRDGIITSL